MIERALALLLLNAFWQPLLVAGVTFLVLRIARGASAATRCAVLTTGLLVAVLLPLASTGALTFSSTATAQSPAQRAPVQTLPFAPPRAVRPLAQQMPHIDNRPRWQFSRPYIAVPSRILLWIVLAWSAVALILLARLLVSLVHLARLRRDALPLPPSSRAQLERWQQKTAGTNLRLCVSGSTPVPIAIGLFDAMVLIPRHLVEDLDPEDLDRIVLHEIAHLRRRDGIVYALQQIAGALFFFSLGLHWIAHALDIEREVACDDWVLERRADIAPYATCLVRLAESTPWPHEALPAPGAFITRHSMSIRVERILRSKRDGRLRAAPATLMSAIVASMAIGIAAFAIAPSLADPQIPHLAVKPRAAARTARHETPVRKPALVAQNAPLPATSAPATSAPATNAPATSAPAPVRTVHRTLVQTRPAARAKVTLVARVTPAPVPVPSSGDYISQIESAFGSKLSVEQIIDLKALEITPQFVQSIRASGYPQATPEQIINVRSVGLTPESIASLRSTFGSLSLPSLSTLASLHIDAAYRNQMLAAGLHDLTPERLVELKSLSITPDYIEKANAFGFGPLTAGQLVELKSLEIDEMFLQKLHAHGFEHPTFRQVIDLKASGVIQ